MTSPEDRVRCATQALANTVPPTGVPLLQLPENGRARRFNGIRRRGGAYSGSPWTRRLTPLAAAAAVVAVGVALVVVGKTTTGTSSGTSPQAAAEGAGPSVASLVAAGTIPAYYLASSNPGGQAPGVAVRATATGATLATIKPPDPGGGIFLMAGAGDDRTFVLDETVPTSQASNSPKQEYLYLLKLGADGQPSSLTKLPYSVPNGEGIGELAVSPDGSKLAVSFYKRENLSHLTLQVQPVIQVVALSTGEVRTWSGNELIASTPAYMDTLSWASDEHTLAFKVDAGHYFFENGTAPPKRAPDPGVWLLNTDLGGTNLFADSRQAVSFTAAGVPTASPGATVVPSDSPTSSPQPSSSGSDSGTPWSVLCDKNAIITPGGSTVVCSEQTGTFPPSSFTATVKTSFAEFSTATGKLTHVLGHVTDSNGDGFSSIWSDVLWSNASGSVLIGVIPKGDKTYQVGVITGNKFSPLPSNTYVASVWSTAAY